ncbi:hypothetical protein K435DRAFT_843395 [Dendrothele bispora CBS 962.96]|uniref:Uncharacterized protein n=1 Tax=Dendrothele bispora (strain CBS 962.96) TaxID=1314807 RepID=A0A4S8L8Q1_DENBC|nr:hypothetical protein K435DRAFT_843395 [Dendrothele bispora CBS 962.96]
MPFVSSSSAIEPKFVRTKAGNAEKLDINTVTPELLVYVAAQVRFALCPIQSWSAKDGKFNLNHFYDNLVKFLYAAPVQWRDKTFRALNEEFFGPADDDNNEPALYSDMALLSEHFHVDSDDRTGIFLPLVKLVAPTKLLPLPLSLL